MKGCAFVKNFESGVSKYIVGKAVIRTGFPVSDKTGRAFIACQYCKMYCMKKCIITGEIIAFPDEYVGNECPLEIESEEI